MKYIIVTNYFYPETGAASNRIFNMANGLNCENVIIICPIPNYPSGKIFSKYRYKLFTKERINKIKIFRYFIIPSNSKNIIIRLLSMLSFALSLWLFVFNLKYILKADKIIIQNSPFLVSLSSIILFKYLFRKKIVLNISDLWPLSALELNSINEGILYSILEKIELFIYKSSDYIMGQSSGILKHVKKRVPTKNFLYLNIQPKTILKVRQNDKKDFKIIYAGLLGVAQNLLKIIKKVDFDSMNIILHIYGEGNEKLSIENFINEKKIKYVKYMGSVSKRQLNQIIPKYNFALVPLKNKITGAVPSKIFELCQHNVPVIFFGDGEGAQIVKKNNLGIVVKHTKFDELKQKIEYLSKMPLKDYNFFKKNCEKYSKKNLDFDSQIEKLNKFLES